MENIIVIVLLVIIVLFALRATIKRLKGKGRCCSGGGYKPKKKKLKTVIEKKTFYVKGMHCEHCKNRVEEAVDCIAGVSATVNLKKNQVLVEYETPVDDTSIINQIEKLGYVVMSVL